MSPASDGARQKRLALVAADPFSTDPGRLDEHAEVVAAALGGVESEWQVLPVFKRSRDTIANVLSEFNPTHVEFSGYGSVTRRVLLENAAGEVTNPTGRSLARLLPAGEGRPDVVTLNGCAVSRGEDALARAARFAIRLEGVTGQAVELDFSRDFYSRIADGAAVPEAFEAAVGPMVEAGRLDPNRYRLIAPPGPRPVGAPSSVEELAFLASRDRELDARGRSAEAGAVQAPEGSYLFPVWYGTNRALKNPRDPSVGFGSRVEPGQPEVLRLGKCTVVIPPSHKTGSVGSPRWQIWKRDRLRIVSRRSLCDEEFYSGLAAAIGAIPDRQSILCYVHGYNVTFDEAVIRAAQLGFDLNVEGETALFSWPSAGRLPAYAADEAAVEASEEALVRFLTGLGKRTNARAVHIIAHSMGNRALLRAINRTVMNADQEARAQFDQILLAAPDVDGGTFRDLAKAFPAVSRRTTLYTCPRDQALRTSGAKFLHNYPRAGFSPPITLVDRIDTIEVRSGGVGLLGHAYYGSTWPVLADMHALLSSDQPPNRRIGLRSRLDITSRLPYWVMV